MRQRLSWGRLATAVAAVILVLASGSAASSQARIPVKITIGVNPAVGLAPGKSVTFVVEARSTDASHSLPDRLRLTFPESTDETTVVRRQDAFCRRTSVRRGVRRIDCTLSPLSYRYSAIVAVRIKLSRSLAGKRFTFTAEVTSSRSGDVVLNSKEWRTVQIGGTARKPPPKTPDITGKWRGGSGGIYTITKSGAAVSWIGQSSATPGSSGKFSWYHRFTGTIRDGVYIVGTFKDDPALSSFQNQGPLVVRIESAKRLVKVGSYKGVTSSPAFGDSVWTR